MNANNIFNLYDDYIHHHATRYVKLPLSCLRSTEHGYHELYPDRQNASFGEIFGLFTNSLDDMLYYRDNQYGENQEYQETSTNIRLPDDFVTRYVTKKDNTVLIKLVWENEYTNKGEYTTTLADCLKQHQHVTLMPVDAIDESTCYGRDFIPDWFNDIRILVIHKEENGVVAECLDSSDYYRAWFLGCQGVFNHEIPTIITKLSDYVEKTDTELVTILEDGVVIKLTDKIFRSHGDKYIRVVDLQHGDGGTQLVVNFVDYDNPDLCYFLNLNEVATSYLEYLFTDRQPPVSLAA